MYVHFFLKCNKIIIIIKYKNIYQFKLYIKSYFIDVCSQSKVYSFALNYNINYEL